MVAERCSCEKDSSCPKRRRENVDRESDVAEEMMSVTVKLAKEINEPCDIELPTAECQSRTPSEERHASQGKKEGARSRGACLDVENEAFHEKDGYMDDPWDLAKSRYKLKANDKATFFSPAEKLVLPSASAREPEERDSFVVDSGASMRMVSERDLNSAELETMRTSRSPTTVMTANGKGANQRRSDGICQTIGLIRHCYASSRNSRSAFIGETLRRTWVHASLEKRSKTTSHQ